MSEFKPKKTKALLIASSQTLLQKSDQVVQAISVRHPAAAALLGTVLAGLNIAVAYKQEQLNQFIEALMNNPDIYTEEILNSVNFQEGAIVHLQSYLRLRSDEKRKLAQKIFDDFGKSTEKPQYPLERYDDTLEKISQQGLRFLGFIHNKIPELQDEYTRIKMKEHGNTGSDKTFEEWRKIYTGNQTALTFIEMYIKKKALEDLGGDAKKVGVTAMSDQESKIRTEFSLLRSEFDQLGLGNSFKIDVGWSTPEPGWNITHYGRMFISVVKPDKLIGF